jgi:hypothetical protein
MVLVAVGIDGNAVDIFHDEIRSAVGHRAAIKKPSYVWVIQLGENLTFHFQARMDTTGQRAAMHDLNGDQLIELRVRALSQENLAHAAGTQGAQYSIRSYAIGRHGRSMRLGAGFPQTAADLAAECAVRLMKATPQNESGASHD